MTDYYVDSGAAGGGNGSLTTPWNTLAAANAVLTGDQHGNRLRLNRGSIFRETFSIAGYGTASGQFTITEYGDGNLPKIYGSTQVTGWANHSGNIWSASCASDPGSLWIVLTDGTVVWAEDKGTHDLCTDEYDWAWESNVLYLNSGGATVGYDPDTLYTSVEKAAGRNTGIDINTKNYFTINYLDICFHNANSESDAGITIWRTDGTNIQYCNLHHNGFLQGSNNPYGNGIIAQIISNSNISNNNIYHNGRRGIAIWSESGYSSASDVIEHNIFYNNCHAMMDVFISGVGGEITDLIIRSNKMYTDSNYGQGFATLLTAHGIFVQGPGASYHLHNAKFYNNIIYNMYNDSSISIERGGSIVEIYNNVTYGKHPSATYAYGIAVPYMSPYNTGITIKNNIGMSSGGAPCLQIDNTSQITAIDYNCWYNPGGNYVIVAGKASSPYTSGEQTTYKSETGYDANGFWENPDFVDPTATVPDFNLLTGSPCIDHGANLYSVGVTDDYAGLSRPQGAAYDIGAYEYEEGEENQSPRGSPSSEPYKIGAIVHRQHFRKIHPKY